MSNFEKITEAGKKDIFLNKATGRYFNDRGVWDNVTLCHDTTIKSGDRESIPMAMTETSNALNQKEYAAAVSTWKASGRIGPSPDWVPYFVEDKDKPNSMELCAWFLTWKRDEKWQKVNAEMIATVQDPAFIDGLTGNNKPIDAMTHTLGANLLHEVRLRCLFEPFQPTVNLETDSNLLIADAYQPWRVAKGPRVK